MANIYQLTDELLDFQRMIEGADDIPEEAIRDTLEGLVGTIEEKLRGYGAVIKNLESDVEGMKHAEKSINDRRKVLENKIERLRGVVEMAMNAAEIEQVKAPDLLIGYRKCAPSAEVIDEEALPDYVFVPQDPKLDKRLLLQLLKDGEPVEGARLVTDKKHFYIK